MARLISVPRNGDSGKFVPTHGLEDTPEYAAWANAIYRCENPNAQQWPLYGARGVAVCDRWRFSFAAFYEDMGPRPSSNHSLDRYPDVNGNYEPGNCRWATAREQSNNKRNTPRIAGMSPKELSAATGLPYTTIANRLRRGWSERRILSQPRRDYPENLAC